MKVVVTGATSFIGAVTIRQLLLKGHQVQAVVRPGSKRLKNLMDHIPQALGLQIQVTELEMEQIEDIQNQEDAYADAWIHTCWEGAGSDNRTLRDVQQSNVESSLRAVRAAFGLGCRRFLFTGSQAEYGICDKLITEDMPCSPVSEYGKAKRAFAVQAEELCTKLSLDYIHGRIFSVYGPGDHPWSLVQSCLKTWSKGGEMRLGECTQWWNFLYIEDAASALISLLEKGEAGTYNVAGRDTRRLREFVEEMYRLCGSKGSYVYGTRPQNAEGQANLLPDITKLCTHTGWEPKTPFAEGIYETLYSLPEADSGKTHI